MLDAPNGSAQLGAILCSHLQAPMFSALLCSFQTQSQCVVLRQFPDIPSTLAQTHICKASFTAEMTVEWVTWGTRLPLSL